MNTGTILGLLIIGLVAGILSSLVGIGGGIVVVPALVFLFAMNQKMAQGTSLAMLLPPIGILGVLTCYTQGYVDLRIAGILSVAFVVGSYFGSKRVSEIDESVVQNIFAIFMLLVET